jgi:hypothetical protein
LIRYERKAPGSEAEELRVGLLEAIKSNLRYCSLVCKAFVLSSTSSQPLDKHEIKEKILISRTADNI